MESALLEVDRAVEPVDFVRVRGGVPLGSEVLEVRADLGADLLMDGFGEGRGSRGPQDAAPITAAPVAATSNAEKRRVIILASGYST